LELEPDPVLSELFEVLDPFELSDEPLELVVDDSLDVVDFSSERFFPPPFDRDEERLSLR
jgi:hypothetical protein